MEEIDDNKLKELRQTCKYFLMNSEMQNGDKEYST